MGRGRAGAAEAPLPRQVGMLRAWASRRCVLYQGAEPPLHLLLAEATGRLCRTILHLFSVLHVLFFGFYLWVRAAARLALLVEGHGEGLRWQLELLACGQG